MIIDFNILDTAFHTEHIFNKIVEINEFVEWIWLGLSKRPCNLSLPFYLHSTALIQDFTTYQASQNSHCLKAFLKSVRILESPGQILTVD